jgi:hypothetical protein
MPALIPLARRAGYRLWVSPDEVLATATSADGRRAELDATTWDYVLAGHPEMANHLDDVIKPLEQPELREDDPRPGRIRYFRRCGPERWVRVVVQFGGETDVVVTAFPHSNDPAGWRS